MKNLIQSPKSKPNKMMQKNLNNAFTALTVRTSKTIID